MKNDNQPINMELTHENLPNVIKLMETLCQSAKIMWTKNQLVSKIGDTSSVKMRAYLLNRLRMQTERTIKTLNELYEIGKARPNGWINPKDAMPERRGASNMTVTVSIWLSGGDVVRGFYDKTSDMWLTLGEWYKPEQVLGWRYLPKDEHSD